MSVIERAGLLARPLLLASPILVGTWVGSHKFPPGLAYAVEDGRWLFVVGVAAAVLTLSFRSWGLVPRFPARLEAWLRGLPERGVWVALWVTGFLVFCSVIPNARWSGASLGGDEHKYLRMAESLYRDLDVDVGSGAQEAPTMRTFLRNLRALGGGVLTAVRGLARAEELVPPGSWRVGDWTIAGRQGGRYYVQSPGLPAVLAPGLALQHRFLPDSEGPLLSLVTVAALWATALVQMSRLAAETSGSRPAGLLAGALTAVSAPVLVGGYNLYPEVVVTAAVPWIVRHARPGGPSSSVPKVVALALAVGALPWLHPKFTLLSLAMGFLLARQLGGRRRALLLCAGLPLAALLLFDHYVTGLFGFDALYRRYGDQVYRGPGVFLSARIPIGLVDGLFAARDGLLVMAPILIAGALALPLLWRRQRSWAGCLLLAFSALWIAAAVHEGGAPGPPGRLLAPVACILGSSLAVGFSEWRSCLAYRWLAAGLALVSGAIVVNMLGHWRNEVDPYRGMFEPHTDFSRDLPDGRRDPGEVVGPRKMRRDLVRGVVLLGILGFWSLRFRPSPGEPDPGEAWRRIRNFHAALWATLSAGAFVLHALGP